VGHEGLAAAASRLGKRRLAGSKITAWCTCITPGREVATACVTKTRLAAIGLTLTARRKTPVTTAVITASKTAAFTAGGGATAVTTSKTTTKTTTVIATTCGTTKATTRLVITVVVRAARGATAATKIATAGTDRKFNRMRPSMARVFGFETRRPRQTKAD
jgi:hypothetical protein